MPQLSRHDDGYKQQRQQLDTTGNMSIRAQKKAALSVVKASYKPPSQSERRRHLTAHLLKTATHPQRYTKPPPSATRVSLTRTQQSRPVSSSNTSSSSRRATGSREPRVPIAALEPSRIASTLLFPKTHPMRPSSATPKSQPVLVSVMSTSPLTIDLDHEHEQEHKLQHKHKHGVINIDKKDTDYSSVDSSRAESDWDVVITDTPTLSAAGPESGAGPEPCGRVSIQNKEDVLHTTSNHHNTEDNANTNPVSHGSLLSTAQLMRQCAHCKVLYYTSHACEKKDPARRPTRPQTAPPGGYEQAVTPSSSLTLPHAQRRGQGSSSHRPHSGSTAKTRPTRPFSSSAASRVSTPLALSPTQQQQQQAQLHRPCSIADSYTRASSRIRPNSTNREGRDNSSARNSNPNYNYKTISSGVRTQRPKSSSSLWRYRPPPSAPAPFPSL